MNVKTEISSTRAQRDPYGATVELIELHYAAVFAFLRRLAGNDADAADLTQRTFAKVQQALPSFAGRSSVSSWIHGIAYHLYADWRRGNGRSESRAEAWWETRPSAEPSPDQQLVRSDLANRVYACVDELEPDLRQTVHLHHYQGLTLQETADAMDVSPSTVKYRLRQALNHLQKNFASDRSQDRAPQPRI